MPLSDILSLEGVVANLKARGKKQALQELCAVAGKLCKINPQQVLEKILEREKLGTTGVGQGVAIPHAKFAGLGKVVGLFARFDHPIDFDSVDERPVDLVFMLIAPEEGSAEHLRTLARVSRLLRNQDLCVKLRGSKDPAALYSLLTEPSASSSAA